MNTFVVDAFFTTLLWSLVLAWCSPFLNQIYFANTLANTALTAGNARNAICNVPDISQM